jgi:hypothetical protein
MARGMIIWKNLDKTHGIPNTIHFALYEETFKILCKDAIQPVTNKILI